MFAADSAADEISAGQMLQRKGLIPHLQQMGLPSLRHVVRDKAHCSRRTDAYGQFCFHPTTHTLVTTPGVVVVVVVKTPALVAATDKIMTLILAVVVVVVV